MSDIFQWITTAYSDREILAKTSLTKRELDNIRDEDWRHLHVSAIHIPTGQRRTVSKDRTDTTSWKHLETMILFDFWEEPISWGEAPIYGRIWQTRVGNREHVHFRIEIGLTDGVFGARFTVPLQELHDPSFPPNFVYRDILDNLVHCIDSELKTRQYGPRP